VLAGLQSDCVWWGALVKSARVALRHASYVPVRIIPELAGSFFRGWGAKRGGVSRLGLKGGDFVPKGCVPRPSDTLIRRSCATKRQIRLLLGMAAEIRLGQDVNRGTTSRKGMRPR
jgi:hypothetical protein